MVSLDANAAAVDNDDDDGGGGGSDGDAISAYSSNCLKDMMNYCS